MGLGCGLHGSLSEVGQPGSVSHGGRGQAFAQRPPLSSIKPFWIVSGYKGKPRLPEGRAHALRNLLAKTVNKELVQPIGIKEVEMPCVWIQGIDLGVAPRTAEEQRSLLGSQTGKPWERPGVSCSLNCEDLEVTP